MASPFVRRITNILSRLDCKLSTATLALRLFRRRNKPAISLLRSYLPKIGFPCPPKCLGFWRGHQSDNKNGRRIFHLYKMRERIHRGIADPRLLPTPLHAGEFQPAIRTEGGFIRISSRLPCRDPLFHPLHHVCSPRRKRHADLTSSPPSSPRIRGAVLHGYLTCNRGCVRYLT